jgi:hypothetical protein
MSDPVDVEPASPEWAQRLAAAERRAELAEARVAELTRELEAARAERPSVVVAPAPAPVAAPVVEAVAAPPVAAAPAAAPAVEVEEEQEPEPHRRNIPRPLTEEEQRIEGYRRALTKRGFRRDDLYYHVCPDCSVQAIEKWGLFGKPGGRDIDLCLACGKARSWRRRPDYEKREADETFDLVTFLR